MDAQIEKSLAALKSDRWITIGLFVLGILSRLPFRSQILYHWDSVNFALAIEHFDVRLHQPHPPGTFVIYVMLGRLFNWFLHDPSAALVWVSILTSGLSAALIFVLVRRWFGRKVGWVVALLTLTSPMLWFHGEVALSYMLEFVWVVLIVILCTDFFHGSDGAFFASALCMGLAGGIRPNTPVFMFPLWAFLTFKRRQPIRKIFVALIVMAAGVALWAVPMIVTSGGPLAYWDIMQWWGQQHLEKSGDANVLVYSARFGMYTFYTLGFALVPIAWAIWRRRRDLIRLLLDDWRVQVLVVWIAPGALYFTLIHLKQPGHTFTILAALVVIAGLAAVVAGRDLAKRVPRAWIALIALLLTGNGLLFLFGPANLFDISRSVFSTPTWASIREYDVDMNNRLEAIRENFGTQDTTVFASSRFFRLPDYYLRDYQLPSLSHQLDDGPIVLPDHVHTLVLFNDSVLPHLVAEPFLHSLPLPGPGNASIRYITWDKDQRVRLSQDSIDIQDR